VLFRRCRLGPDSDGVGDRFPALPLPVLSITNTISVSLIGYGVISRQLFNPLREREARLLVINRIAAAVGI
jgi:hypothetical protein